MGDLEDARRAKVQTWVEVKSRLERETGQGMINPKEVHLFR